MKDNSRTQKEIIKARLHEAGFVSRNWALQNYISRLSPLIIRIKGEGYVFSDNHTGLNKNDYYYHVEKLPE
jgi:hypothetical protein|tara:strand:+ start:1385 stop:1597 length:213 start_codon:yes stop_codon:yes gene_type:complete